MKKFLEAIYTRQANLPPTLTAKSLALTAAVILEIFPVVVRDHQASLNLLDDLLPLSKIGRLVAMAADVPTSDRSAFLTDVIDALTFVCKSEQHVGRVARDDRIFDLLRQAIGSVKTGRQVVLHAAISFGASMLADKTKRNFEIANDKWGCDMEGFLMLEQVRAKASKETATLLGSYGQKEIQEAGVKKKLLKDLGIANLLAEYCVDLQVERQSALVTESLLDLLTDLAEDKATRPCLVSRALFAYLHEIFSSKSSSAKVKAKVGELVASIGSAVNPASLSYGLQQFVVDLAVEAMQTSSKELVIFESLLW